MYVPPPTPIMLPPDLLAASTMAMAAPAESFDSSCAPLKERGKVLAGP